jgi:hypothetical protein
MIMSLGVIPSCHLDQDEPQSNPDNEPGSEPSQGFSQDKDRTKGGFPLFSRAYQFHDSVDWRTVRTTGHALSFQ